MVDGEAPSARSPRLGLARVMVRPASEFPPANARAPFSSGRDRDRPAAGAGLGVNDGSLLAECSPAVARQAGAERRAICRGSATR